MKAKSVVDVVRVISESKEEKKYSKQVKITFERRMKWVGDKLSPPEIKNLIQKGVSRVNRL